MLCSTVELQLKFSSMFFLKNLVSRPIRKFIPFKWMIVDILGGFRLVLNRIQLVLFLFSYF